MTSPATSSTQAPTQTRMHVGLAVRDIERSRAFYQDLLGHAPTKVEAGYAKFDLQNPPLNLSLTQLDHAQAAARPGQAHFGVQVGSEEALGVARARLVAAGRSVRDEERVTCCYAVQSKLWTTDPDGNEWEVFLFHEDAETFFDTPADEASDTREGAAKAAGGCCAPSCCS